MLRELVLVVEVKVLVYNAYFRYVRVGVMVPYWWFLIGEHFGFKILSIDGLVMS